MTGRYKAYPEYMDSGVQWLNRIPSHWFSTQIKYGFDITLGKMLTKEPKNSSYQLRAYLKAVNIQTSGVDVSSVEKMWFSPSELTSLRLEKNDLLISEGGDVGRSAIWNEELPECYIQNAINRARPLKANVSKFLFYWIHSLKHSGFIDIICNKATIAHYTAEKVEASPLFLPPQEEQQKIANFLDHETAKIDTLITKQEKLIELLKEKRQAVISHVVTKGLNPDAPMKDSGVEWLGEVPEHWVVCCLKHIKGKEKGSFVDGPFGSNLKSEHFVDDGDVYVIESNFATTGILDKSKLKTISNAHFSTISRSETKQGSIIIAKIGARYGMNSVMPALDKKAVVSGNSLSLTVDTNRMNVDYCHHLLTHLKQEEAMDDGVNVTAQPALSLGQLNNLPFLELPLDEQEEIIAFLDKKRRYFSSMLSHSEKMILLSKERKAALISAAVTGKIDVRHFVSKQGQTPIEQ